MPHVTVKCPKCGDQFMTGVPRIARPPKEMIVPARCVCGHRFKPWIVLRGARWKARR
jgi:hypothetical protein